MTALMALSSDQRYAKLGLFGTFITVPGEQDAREGQLATFLTPANSRSDVTMQPDSFDKRQLAI